MAESDLMDELTGTKTPVRTVHVCLLVAVWPDGTWRVLEQSHARAPVSVRKAMENATTGASLHWVEADIPLPIPSEPAVVVGRVVKEG